MGLIQYRRRILNNAPRIETASGAVASFNTDIAAPLKECKISFLPVQDGSGDPAPDNVRPINGWTGVQIEHCGKNLFDETKVNFWRWIDANGKETSSTSGCVSDYIFIPTPKNILVMFHGVCPYSVSVMEYNASKDFIKRTHKALSRDATPLIIALNANTKFIRVQVYVPETGQTHSAQILASEKIQLEFGTVATDYEPYHGQTIPINWQTEAGTIYGGTLEVISGVLTVDMAMVDLGSLTWAKYNDVTIPVYYAMVSGMDRTRAKTICSQYRLNENWIALNVIPDKTAQTHPSLAYIYVRDDDYLDATAFKSAMSGVQLCYELAEPIEIQLTPHKVNSLLGQNNIYADANGEVTVKYWTH